jgi:hypothetical protein
VVPPDSCKVPRVPQYSGINTGHECDSYGTLTLYGAPFQAPSRSHSQIPLGVPSISAGTQHETRALPLGHTNMCTPDETRVRSLLCVRHKKSQDRADLPLSCERASCLLCLPLARGLRACLVPLARMLGPRIRRQLPTPYSKTLLPVVKKRPVDPTTPLTEANGLGWGPFARRY